MVAAPVTRIPVLHLPPGAKWDQVDLLAMFDETRFDLQPGRVTGGAVVVVPAGDWTPAAVNDLIVDFDWALVILTSDERSTFDHRALRHRNMRLWVMTPRPGRHAPGEARYVGEGAGPDTRRVLDGIDPPRLVDCWFGGQVNHPSRAELVRVLETMPAAKATPTPGFLQGLPRERYLDALATTRFAPAPAGPGTPDSFRFYEAIEAGCVPVVEDTCPGWAEPGYWHLVYGDEELPFPVLAGREDRWEFLPGVVADLAPDWQGHANRVGAWWLHRRRTERLWLDEDLAELGADLASRSDVTVIVTSSPIPSHPDTAIVEETVESVRWHLPDAEVLVTVDGVRTEQAGMAGAYDEYQRRLLRLCRRWRNAVPVVADDHQHQANMVRRALELVRTPLVLVVEHDTPLVTDCGPIPFDRMGEAIQAGEVNSIRLLHEALVLPDYEHLMLEPHPVEIRGVPMRRTMQFSARPHLASTAWYRQMLDTYFAPGCRTFIEDSMHGVVDHAWRTEGAMGWNLWRLAIYEPPGNAKRSLHSDGRAGGEKYDDCLVFAYPGRTPVGAPLATSERS